MNEVVCAERPSLRNIIGDICGPRRSSNEIDAKADEFLYDFGQLITALDTALTPEMRHDLKLFLNEMDAQRGELSKTLIAWINLVEEVCLTIEIDYGSHTGALKLEQVRAVIFQLTQSFVGDAQLLSLPAFVRPLAIDVLSRVTVEFIIGIVNAQETSQSIWANTLSAQSTSTGSINIKVRARFSKNKTRFFEWLVAWLLRPPTLPRDLQTKVDGITDQWDRETALTGQPPIERVLKSLLMFLSWIGEHAGALKHGVAALSIITKWAFEFSDIDDAERSALIKRALLRYISDLGLDAALLQRMAELIIDLSVDMAVALFRKRYENPA